MAQAGDYIYASQVPGLGIAMLYRAAAQTLTTATQTDISFDTAVLDRQGGWALSPNPTRFTPKLAGWYAVSGFVGYAANATGTRRAAVKKNGTYVPGGFYQDAPASAAFTFRVFTPVTLVQMNGTTDYFALEAYQGSGGNLATLSSSDGQPNLTVVYAGSA